MHNKGKTVFAIFTVLACSQCASIHDPYLWLENVSSSRSQRWVIQQNRQAVTKIEINPYPEFLSEATAILLAKDKVPEPKIVGNNVFNFWQDEEHPRGLWRRTSLSQYGKTEPKWELLLDLDQLAKTERENWYWKGANCLPPVYDHCLIRLSRGGKDAVVIREFLVSERNFIKNGFNLNEAKSLVGWIDQNQIFVGTDFGPGSLSNAGYPRIVKLWRRGTPLTLAHTVFSQTQSTDVSATGWCSLRKEGRYSLIILNKTLWETEKFLFQFKEDHLDRLPLPEDAEVEGVFHGLLIFRLRSDWIRSGRTYSRDSLLALPLKEPFNSSLELIFDGADQSRFFRAVSMGRNSIFIEVLNNVHPLVLQAIRKKNTRWELRSVALPTGGSSEIYGQDPWSGLIFFRFESYLTQPTLYWAREEKGKFISKHFTQLKKWPERFPAGDLVEEQLWTMSKDSTRIPYFLVHKKEMQHNGQNPTLLEGYGGFGISLTPNYSGVLGKLWLERGGVFAVANIRGGGEFGEAWHKAALKEHRQRAFDDFIAVAEDLIHRQITSPAHMGIIGGSNGGLLVGASVTQHPELFRSAVCWVPLLDMLRYHKLPPGSSWIGEYGDPGNPDRPNDQRPESEALRRAILAYSPYQNVRSGVIYPQILFFTANDDRVHRGHARKMAAKMEDFGQNVLYYEMDAGGHGTSATPQLASQREAMFYSFIWNSLEEEAP